MNTPTTINTYSRGDVHGSNYRLLSEPIKLQSKAACFLEAAGTDSWEDDGGAIVDNIPVVETVEETNRRLMRVRGARKQRAAKAYRPIESIKVINTNKPAEPIVAMAEASGRTVDEEKILQLQAKIAQLMGQVKKQEEAKVKKQESVARLVETFNEQKRIKVVL